MLNIIFVWVISYLLFTLLTAALAVLINKIYKMELDFSKVIQISNAGLGVSLMISFMAMLVVLQLDVKGEEKTLYLFSVFIVGYLFTVMISLYSQISFHKKSKFN
ncbi:MAG: hypothetical protein QM504_14645 [Pseudomonadota bacterium]